MWNGWKKSATKTTEAEGTDALVEVVSPTETGDTMKKTATLFSVILLGFCFTSFSGLTSEEVALGTSTAGTKIRIAFDDEEIVVALFDTPVSRDFVSLLPLEAEFEDYARTEKITILPRKLITQGGITGSSVEGDFTYYAPWGNLAVFYKGFGSGKNLYHLGRIESGKEKLAGMNRTFSARIEILE